MGRRVHLVCVRTAGSLAKLERVVAENNALNAGDPDNLLTLEAIIKHNGKIYFEYHAFTSDTRTNELLRGLFHNDYHPPFDKPGWFNREVEILPKSLLPPESGSDLPPFELLRAWAR